MSRVLRALGGTAALVLVAGLLGVGTAVAREPQPDPAATGAPAVGACYELTLKQAIGTAAPAAPVDCAARHTMVVTAVGQLPASLDWTTLDSEKLPRMLSDALHDTCDPAVDQLIGPVTRRARTLYADFWFRPTEAETAAGARWFSCLVALAETRRLIPIPAGQPAKLTSRVPDELARCFRNSKGGMPSVACSTGHHWRSTHAKLVRRKPSERQLEKAALRTCPRRVSTKEWIYAFTPVDRTSFVVVCAAKTPR